MSSIRRFRPFGLLCVLLLGVLLLASCGDDDEAADVGGDGTTTTTTAALTGDPVKMVFVTSVTGGAYATPEQKDGVEAAVAAVNASGGVQGRPLEVEVCDGKNTPTDTGACYRSATSDPDVVALFGQSLYADQSKDVIEGAKIAHATPLPVGAFDLTNAASFPFTGGTFLQFAGAANAAVEDGGKTVGLIRNDVAAADRLEAAVKAAVAASGGELTTVVKVAPTATDLAAAAAEMQQTNPDAVVCPIPLSQVTPFVQALRQGGYEGAIYVGGTQLDDTYLENLGVDPGELRMVTMFPLASDTSTEWGKAFNADMDEHAPDGRRTENTLGGWASVKIMASLLEDLDAIDRASVLAALNGASGLESGGLLKPIDFTKPGPLAGMGLTRPPHDGYTVAEATGEAWKWDGEIRSVNLGG